MSAPSGTVLVTGAASGIGFACADSLTRAGTPVVLVDRRHDALETAVDRLTENGAPVRAAATDVTDEESVLALVRQTATAGPISGLVNAAGVGIERPFLDTGLEDWDRVLAVNVRAAFLLSREVARTMTSSGGSLVHIASIDASGTGGQAAAYSASKSALLGLSRSMAVELGPLGIRSNCVSPGFVDTPFDRWSDDALAHLRSDFRRTPLRRILRPEEIAAAVRFLITDEASGITGTNLVVDGGLTADWYSVETVPGYRPIVASPADR